MTSTLKLGSKIPISEIDGTIATDEDLSLKANTDMDNVSADGKEEVNTWGLPDYTKGVNKDWSSTHTAECNGWVYAGMQINHAAYAYRSAFLKIDDSQFIVYSSNVESGGIDNELFLPIRKGSVYKITEQGGAQVLQRRLKFYPCISEGV